VNLNSGDMKIFLSIAQGPQKQKEKRRDSNIKAPK
jgi:hypothetical protein